MAKAPITPPHAANARPAAASLSVPCRAAPPKPKATQIIRLISARPVRGTIRHARGERLYEATAYPFIDGDKDADSNMQWDEAVQVVADALKNHQPEAIDFLMGIAPDHLFDLTTELAAQTGMNLPVRV